MCHAASQKPEEPNPASLIISFFALFFTGITALSSIIFFAIKERRETRETSLRIKKLELELAELKTKAEEREPKIII
jgi:hypothetical protein